MSKQDRLKEALRDNLKRRKTQACGRALAADGKASDSNGGKLVEDPPKDVEEPPR